MPRTIRLLWLIVGCTPAAPESESCAGLAGDECALYAKCVLVEGYRNGGGAMEPAGCVFTARPAQLACPPAEICAHDPTAEEDCWSIPSGCLPDGWEAGCVNDPDGCFDGADR